MFVKISCVFLLFFVGFGYGLHPSSRMNDDTEVDITAHPYQVNIEYKIMYRCSGVLLRESWVLTAAQCVADLDVNQLRIRAGTKMRDILGELRDVSQVTTHPNFNVETLDYDLALLYISESYTFSDTIGNVNISSTVPYTGYMLTTTGWGALSPGTWLAMNLLEAQVPFIYHNDCVYSYQGIANTVTDNMICAGEEGNGACHGDTGNPLLYDGEVIGIMSWSYGCGEAKFPSVYTAVYKFKSWIENIVFPEGSTTTTTTTESSTTSPTTAITASTSTSTSEATTQTTVLV